MMGARGPLAQTDNVRNIRGNPGRRQSPRSAQQSVVAGIPEPPGWLEGEALAEWHRITPELERMHLLANLDRGVLAVYCRTWGIWVAADPESAQARYAAASLVPMMKELGLTPNARLRMKTPEPEDVEALGLD